MRSASMGFCLSDEIFLCGREKRRTFCAGKRARADAFPGAVSSLPHPDHFSLYIGQSPSPAANLPLRHSSTFAAPICDAGVVRKENAVLTVARAGTPLSMPVRVAPVWPPSVFRPRMGWTRGGLPCRGGIPCRISRDGRVVCLRQLRETKVSRPKDLGLSKFGWARAPGRSAVSCGLIVRSGHLPRGGSLPPAFEKNVYCQGRCPYTRGIYLGNSRFGNSQCIFG